MKLKNNICILNETILIEVFIFRKIEVPIFHKYGKIKYLLTETFQ